MRLILGFGFLFVVVSITHSMLLTPQTAEPVYAGKTVSQWLESGHDQASMALQEIGPMAAPYVLAKLRREASGDGWLSWYRSTWDRIPRKVRKLLPPPKSNTFDEMHACSALLELGPRVVPLLSTRLNDQNPAVREACVHALGKLREQGRDVRVAIPELVGLLADPEIKVRMRAAWALGLDGPHPR